MPCTAEASSSTSPACRPARTSRPCERSVTMISEAQVTPRAGPSKVARKPSPALSISRPRWPAIALRTRSRWPSSSIDQARSPSAAARSVEPTMSVKRTVANARVGSGGVRTPTRNSSVSASNAPELPSHGCASLPGSSTSRAPAMCSARYLPSRRARPGRRCGAARAWAGGCWAGPSAGLPCSFELRELTHAFCVHVRWDMSTSHSNASWSPLSDGNWRRIHCSVHSRRLGERRSWPRNASHRSSDHCHGTS